MSESYFAELMPTLSRRSTQAVISQLGFANLPLRRKLQELFTDIYGADGTFLADPTFEAVFGWKTAEPALGDLEGSVLEPELVEALDGAGDFAFKREMHPYRHQLDAWEVLGTKDPQSLIVTSGTGSGKTECFMIPILDHLVRLKRELGRLVGVRALFLYPLNALINNQRNRLRAWTEPFGGDIRFCLYNGNTPERPDRSRVQRESPSEVLDREHLRSQAPPILVTNATMLEYMLVRTQDAPILEQSHGKLEWIVLDEAHTYIGSQAAEISLLLRRVMHAFGVSADRVRFVATSATIGDPEGTAGQQLREFLADLAGVDMGQVHLVAGERAIPQLPEVQVGEAGTLSHLEAIDQGIAVSSARFEHLASHPLARCIRGRFTEASDGATVARLSQVCQVIHGPKENYSLEEQQEGLRWLDLLSGTRKEEGGEAFLPLRGHLFHQTLSGIWACADKGCSLKEGTVLDHPAWPFGTVYLEPRKHCSCGSLACEVVSCDDCGEVYLIAGENEGRLYHLNPPHALDEFELDGEEYIEDEEESRSIESRKQNKVLIANRNLEGTGPISIDRRERNITERADTTLELLAQEDEGDGLFCPTCSAKESERRHLFRHGRVSAPFLLGNILPTLLEYAPDGKKPQDHPYRGRRLLSFTDSRQGTARLAAKLQQEAERNRVRGLVYHLCIQHAAGSDSGEVEKLIADLEDLRKAYDRTPFEGLKNAIEEKESEIAKRGKPQPILFTELATELANQFRDIRFMRQTYRAHAPSLFENNQGDVTLTRMFLVREFGRRPKRANNLESMGLVATHYPALEKLGELPRDVEIHTDFGLEDWRSFLKICLDYFVRGGGSLAFPREWKNWLGMRFGQTWLLPATAEEVGKGQRRWPTVRRGRSTSMLVRLLAYVLELDSESAYGEDRIDAVLRCAWDTLVGKRILRQQEPGWQLPLDQLAFLPMTRGYACPVTRRLLDTTLRGITPYLPRNAGAVKAQCEAYEIPVYPTPFGGVGDELERIRRARSWLAEEERVGQLRQEGLWPDLNDRVIELAPFFRSAEHSAQQDAKRLQDYEEGFQAGKINLLSCSTTMEMGIDIGGVSLVSMNNVPPHPASYLQRAGRAGRRRESRSLALTLCKSNPHDQSVFGNTRWAFDTSLAAPKVSLDSPVIVQRHIQALLLTVYFRKAMAEGDQEQLKLTCEAFFGGEPQSMATAFSAWCRGVRTSGDPELEAGLRQLLARTLYEQRSLDNVLESAAQSMEELATQWRTEWNNLRQEQEQVKREAGENSPAYRAVGYHLRRLSEEYLLRELANKGFLPGYGFPTDITPFDNYTVERFKRDRKRQEHGREDNRNRYREMPSRDLVTALREYAPGSRVVMDGLVYRSAGLTLNWHVPADQEDIKEVQNIKWAWCCQQCGDSGTVHSKQEADNCPGCGAAIQSSCRRRFIEPAGFAVDFYESPSNDVDQQEFVPVEPPWIAAAGEWRSLPNPDLGRFRTTTKGHIFHQSSGVHNSGYALCLECGRAEPMPSPGEMPQIFGKPHRKLRRGKDDSPECPGSHDDWKVMDSVTLGHETWTDICEFQLKTVQGQWLADEVAANTIAVALRDALASLRGVENTELACATKRVRTEEGARCQSIVIFDVNAAGYSSSIHYDIGDLFRQARDNLLCSQDCDSVCPHCVLDFDQRFAAEHLDRRRALSVVTAEWINALDVPLRFAYFGKNTRPVFRSLIESIWEEVAGGAVSELRLYTGGDLENWDIGISPLRKLAYQVAVRGIQVKLVIPADTIERLEEEQRYLLRSLLDAPNISIYGFNLPERCGEGWLLAESIEAKVRRWAGDQEAGLHFNERWGAVESMLMSTLIDQPAPLEAESLAAEALRLHVGAEGDRELEVGGELNGPLNGFGSRFWSYLESEHRGVATLLDSTSVITAIHYEDRYLFSPLSIRLLFELIKGLRREVGVERWSAPVIQVDTLASKRLHGRRGAPPRFLWDDWYDQEKRHQVIGELLGNLGGELRLNCQETRQSHARRLEVEFGREGRLVLRFDQGVGYWRVARSEGHWKKLFPFDDPDPRKQALALLKSDVQIVGAKFPTQLFVRLEVA